MTIIINYKLEIFRATIMHASNIVYNFFFNYGISFKIE